MSAAGWTRFWTVLSFSILGLSAAGKVHALVEFGPLMAAAHPGLSVPVWVLATAAVVCEVALLAIAALRLQKAYAVGMALLSVVFLSFHALEGFGLRGPCKCLGSLSSIHPFVSANESVIAIGLSFLLLASAGALLSRPQELPPGSPYVPAAVGVLIWASLAVAGLISIGPSISSSDEQMEVAKAIAYRAFPERMAAAWNDQSLLWTRMIAFLSGDPVGVSRALTVGLGCLIPAGLAFALARHGLPWAAVLSGPCMFMTYFSAIPAVTGELEIPALALGCSVAIPLFYRQNFLAGIVAALAVALKPTAAIAILIVITLSWPRAPLRFGAAALVSAVLTLQAAGFRWSEALASHTNLTPVIAAYRIQDRVFTQSLVALLVMGFGSFLVAWRAPRAFVLSAIGLLAVVFAIHLVHQPFWSYYSTHFMLVFCLIVGGALATFRLPVIILATCAISIFSPLHWQSTPNLAPKLIQESVKTWNRVPRTILTQRAELAYLTDTVPIPEFALFPAKREWAGEAQAIDVARVIEEWEPDIVCLRPDYIAAKPIRHVLTGWHRVGVYGGSEIWTAPHVPFHTFPEKTFKSLGL